MSQAFRSPFPQLRKAPQEESPPPEPKEPTIINRSLGSAVKKAMMMTQGRGTNQQVEGEKLEAPLPTVQLPNTTMREAKPEPPPPAPPQALPDLPSAANKPDLNAALQSASGCFGPPLGSLEKPPIRAWQG